MADPFKERAKYYKKQKDNIFQKKVSRDPSIIEGLKASSIGQLLGYEPEGPGVEAPISESLAFKAGALGGDLPAMTGGSMLGGALAGLAGGGPLGAALGAGAGAFGLPELIKQIVSYAKTPSREDTSAIEKLGSIGDIGLQTGKQALIGAATGGAGRLFPFLKAIPGLGKLAGTKLGSAAIKTGAELTAMTGAGAALEGELPSAREIAENALLLGGMKTAGAGARGIRRALGKKVLPKATVKTAKAELDIFKKRALELAPKAVRKPIERFKKQQPYFDLLREHIGKRNERLVESQFRRARQLAKVQKEGKFTPTELKGINEYFKTKKVSKDLSPKAKKFVNDVIKPHIKQTVKTWENHPVTKNINLPKFLEYTGLEKEGKLFGRDIVKSVENYDKLIAKGIGNAELIEKLKGIEKKTGDRVVVNPNEAKAYKQAKESGFVPFQDPFVKEYNPVKGKRFKPSDKPALVAPEFADAFQGVFDKNAYKPGSGFWKSYDNVADMIRFGRVRLSFFHYVPLTESASAALGPKKALSFSSIAKEGNALRSNEAFMKDAARHGLVVHKSVERYERAKVTGDKLVDAAMKYLPEKVVTKAQNNLVSKGIKKLASAQKYLFEKYHPNLKAVTWQDFVNKEIGNLIKEGKPPTPEQRTKIKTQMADLVNSMYGGQNWDVQRVFNSPQYRKWLRRAIAYPDWTTSAIRQASGVLSGGLKGNVSRNYWMRFGINALLAHGALKFVFGGLKQTDEDKSVTGIRFDPVKAIKTISDPDPIEWYKFPLPDIPVKIGGKIFNPGREAETEWKKEGSKLYSHFGKQALEIKDWAKHPLRTYFSKSNPLISMIWKQILDTTPSDRESFTVRGKWKKGARKRMPWDATEPYTAARLVSRLASVVEDVSPFAMRTLFDKGIAPYVATGLGSIPISKGTTTYKAAPELEKAIRKNDVKMLNRIRAALKDNGFTDKQIKRAVNSARRRAKK